MIGKRTEQVLNRAVKQAVDQDHEYLMLEHVLWSLLREGDVREALTQCGADVDRLRLDLEEHLGESLLKHSSSEEKSQRAQNSEASADHPIPTLAIQRLIQRAIIQVQSSGKSEVMPLDLMVSMFGAKDSHALYLLQKQNIERLDLVQVISHGLSQEETSGDGSLTSQIQADSGVSAKEDPLELYTQDLNKRARDGKIDPLVGRTHELERIVQTLCRRRKNNPLLVGEAGVGKTALAEGLAVRIVEGQVPDLLAKARVFALDMGALLAGAKFRGDFEQRLKKVLTALTRLLSQGEMPILFIDEIHTIIGAGSVQGGSLDAANLLKPALTQGELRCVGSTTYSEYRNVFEKDHALARRFQKIDVPEPSTEEAIQILNGLKSRFEDHHQVIYTPEALRAAVELSVKHLTDRMLPDKAIDIIDEAGAKARLDRSKGAAAGVDADKLASGSKGEDASTSGRTLIDAAAIETMVAQVARIPARSVSLTQKERLKNLERDLKHSIYGQDSAVSALVTAIRLARSGLRSGDKPVGCFLFCGPTGVGKTELAKQLGNSLGIHLARFDMSEYGERHTVSRLIGAPPGYVGFDQAGLLTDAVLKNPHSVVLLDEIEKAHSEIWNILLQVMDHGTLTDNNGRKVDFRNVVLILTSNVGSREQERRSVGIGELQSPLHAAKKAVEQTFTPEFRNRLDAIVYFNALDPKTVIQVVSKQLTELETQLLAKGVDLEVSDEARDWLATKGYDRLLGARPLARLIQDQIKKPLAEEILFGRLENGGKVRIKKKPDLEELDFEYTPSDTLASGSGKEGGPSRSRSKKIPSEVS
jgi:ATP-dependent Clp protease ATP-binding subunit ClpA